MVLGLPNCPEHFVAAIAAWKLGACVLPLSSAMVARKHELLDIAKPSLIVSDWSRRQLDSGSRGPNYPRQDICRTNRCQTVQRRPARPSRRADQPAARDHRRPESLGKISRTMAGCVGVRPRYANGADQLVAGPLYHNGPFTRSHMGLFEDHQLVVMERFDPVRFLDLIERHRVNFGFMVPTMMHRIIRVPGAGSRDFSSVEGFWHAGGTLRTMAEASVDPTTRRQEVV